MQAQLPSIGKRNFSLDVLRGVAILLVLIRHLPPTKLHSTGAINAVVLWISSIGHIGVDLFFVLSGFLISGLIYSEYDRYDGFRPGRFLWRRGLKIWPSYFVAYGGMTCLRVAAELWKGNPARAGDLASNAVCDVVFLQNYWSWPCEPWSHSWSLAVEEHFYTVFAILAALLAWHARVRHKQGKQAFSVLLPAAVLVAIVALGLRILDCFPNYHGGFAAYYQSHMRADSLFCGVALGYLARYRMTDGLRRLARWPMVTLALISAAIWPTLFPIHHSPWAESIGITLVYLSFAFAVLSASLHSDFGRYSRGVSGWLMRGIAKVGIYSYTIYLAHAVIFGIPGVETMRQRLLAWLLHGFTETTVLWVDRSIYWIAAIALGVALSHAVERPFLRLRERIAPSRSKSGLATMVSDSRHGEIA